jgi:hypothetical protein
VYLELIVEGVVQKRDFGIKVSHFLDQSAKPVAVIPMKEGKPVSKVSVDPHSPLIYLALDASAIKPDGPYKGEILFTDKTGIVETLVLTLTRELPEFRVPKPLHDGTYSVNVSENGKALLSVSLGEFGDITPSEKQTIKLVLSEFLDDDGETAAVTIVEVKRQLPGQTQRTDEGVSTCGDMEQTAGVTCRQISLPSKRIDVILDASALKSGKSYEGSLRLLTSASPTSIDLALTLVCKAVAQKASLLAEIQPEVVSPDCWWGSCVPHPSYIRLHESSAERVVRGLSVSWEKLQNAVTPLAFDPDSISVILMQDSDADKPVILWPPSSADTVELGEASIAPGGYARLKVVWPKLPPGDHGVVLRLNAETIDYAGAPKLSLHVSILRPWLYAALVLLAAILFSYFSTKGVQNYRQAQAMNRRIARLSDLPWLRRNRSHISPIVQATAVLSRAGTAIESELGWVFGFRSAAVLTEVGSSLDQLEKMMPYLERLSRQWDYWEQREAGPVRRRALYQLQWLADRLGELQLGEEVDEEIITRLKAIEEWRDPQKLLSKFWSDMEPAMQGLKQNMILEQFDQGADQLSHLMNAVTALKEPAAGVTDLGNCLEALKRLGEKVDNHDGAAEQLQQLFDIWRDMDQRLPQDLNSAVERVSNHQKTYEQGGVYPLEAELSSVKRLLEQETFWTQLWDGIHQPLKQITLHDQMQMHELTGLSELLEEIKSNHATLTTNVDIALQQTATLKNSHREIVRSLLLGMDPDNPPSKLSEAVFRERNYYSPLKLIADQYDMVHRADLIKLYQQGTELQELYDQADDWVWRDLNACKASFRLPKTIEKQEAYRLIHFEVAPGKGADLKSVANTFAFKHRFVYCWKIEFTKPLKFWQRQKNGRNSSGQRVVLNPITQHPRVTQFIPHRDVEVTVSVTIYRDEKTASLVTSAA